MNALFEEVSPFSVIQSWLTAIIQLYNPNNWSKLSVDGSVTLLVVPVDSSHIVVAGLEAMA